MLSRSGPAKADSLDQVLLLGAAAIIDLAQIGYMRHNVHMKTITIRELHLETGRWVRHAASGRVIVVTDRGRRIAALQAFDGSSSHLPLPNREAKIRKRSQVLLDSVVYQAESRDDR